MRKLAKLAKVIALGAALSTSGAYAANVTFGGQDATDGSGRTSSFVDPSNNVPFGSGFFIETFDVATAPQIPTGFDVNGVPTGFAPAVGTTEYNDAGFDGECAVNSVNGSPLGVSVTPVGPTNEVNVRQGSVQNQAAAPLNDDTCFGYLTNNGTGTATVEFDYSNLISAFDDTGITYLGFYWGSVDDYNEFVFFSDEFETDPLTGEFVLDVNGQRIKTGVTTEVARVTGPDLLARLGGDSGSQTSDNSNVYVNIFFGLDEQFTRMVINTTGIAGEFDNLVVGLSQRPVPAPAGIALLACGLLALGLRSRFKK